ncbi:hypothetical protein EW145_g8697 [Phellinidium pouzarii]|uniref:Uncharacterized protein n=1 Tax=Phellinidium pouzarii TaxID=167371 RepID=A0A4S4K449_9AGAM|nr:hypothetical protein EW145_g8697 [Phellinidium pouzarii]
MRILVKRTLKGDVHALGDDTDLFERGLDRCVDVNWDKEPKLFHSACVCLSTQSSGDLGAQHDSSRPARIAREAHAYAADELRLRPSYDRRPSQLYLFRRRSRVSAICPSWTRREHECECETIRAPRAGG